MPAENATAGNPPGISESGKSMAGAVRDWLRGVSDLATLEIRYSIQSITAALVATLVLGAVMFASWCLVLLAIAVAILQAGWGWIPAVLFVLMLNLLFAVFLWHTIQTLISRVGMDGTRGALGLDKTAHYDEPAQTHPGT